MTLDMTHDASPASARIQGRTLTFPVRFSDARLRAGVFLGRASAVSAELSRHDLVGVSVLGRIPTIVMSIRYTTSDLGSYDEVGIMVPARHDGRFGLYTLDLPVTEDFTREAGQVLWGLPKWVADIDLSDDGIHLTDHGQHVMSAVIRTPRLPVPGSLTTQVNCWGVLNDRLVRMPNSMTARGIRMGLGAAEVLPGGTHRMAGLLRDLGFPRRALVRVTIANLSAALGAATQ